MNIFLVFQEIPQGYCLFLSGDPNDTSLAGNLSRFIVTLLKCHVKSYSTTVSETQSMVHHPTTIHRQSNMADTVAVGIEIEIIKH